MLRGSLLLTRLPVSGCVNFPARMSIEFRRVVTGNEDGKSEFTDERALTPGSFASRPGSEFFEVWGTADAGDPGQTDRAEPLPFFPAPGGTRFVIFRFPPEAAGTQAVTDVGFSHVFEEGSRMHRTDTIDYGICLDGEIWLELDDGAEVHVTPGTCVVQRGTRHAWHNRSDRHCTMAFFVLGTTAGRA